MCYRDALWLETAMGSDLGLYQTTMGQSIYKYRILGAVATVPRSGHPVNLYKSTMSNMERGEKEKHL